MRGGGRRPTEGIAVVFAGLTIVENLVEMARRRCGTLPFIALAVVAIYAIVVHGRDAANA